MTFHMLYFHPTLFLKDKGADKNGTLKSDSLNACVQFLELKIGSFERVFTKIFSLVYNSIRFGGDLFTSTLQACAFQTDVN